MLNAPSPPLFLSPKETARTLGVSYWWVSDALRRNVLRGKKLGRRTLITYESVMALSASLKDASFSPPRRRINTNHIMSLAE
jgi:excisionase family DNA binding protein